MGEIDADESRLLRAVASVAINTALWLTQSGFVAKPTLPVRRLGKNGKPSKHDSGYRPVIYTVGSTIKLDDLSRLRDHARAYAEKGGDRAGWRVQARYVVIGHHRRQAYGAGRAERKRIWIQPYWKGPEAGEALAKTYAIDTELFAGDMLDGGRSRKKGT